MNWFYLHHLIWLAPFQTLVLYALGVVLQDPNTWPSPYKYEVTVPTSWLLIFMCLHVLRFSFSKFWGENSVCDNNTINKSHCLPFLCSLIFFLFHESSVCYSFIATCILRSVCLISASLSSVGFWNSFVVKQALLMLGFFFHSIGHSYSAP